MRNRRTSRAPGTPRPWPPKEKQVPVLTESMMNKMIESTGAVPKAITPVIRQKVLKSGFTAQQIKDMDPFQAHYIAWERDAMVAKLGGSLFEEMQGIEKTQMKNRSQEQGGKGSQAQGAPAPEAARQDHREIPRREKERELESAVTSFGQFDLNRKFSRNETPEEVPQPSPAAAEKPASIEGGDIAWAKGKLAFLRSRRQAMQLMLANAGLEEKDATGVESLFKYIPMAERLVSEYGEIKPEKFRFRMKNIVSAFEKYYKQALEKNKLGMYQEEAERSAEATENIALDPDSPEAHLGQAASGIDRAQAILERLRGRAAPDAAPIAAPEIVPAAAESETVEPEAVAEQTDPLGIRPVPVDLDALIANRSPEEAAAAINADLERFYDEYAERQLQANVFFDPSKRELWRARIVAGALANEFAQAPAEEREAKLQLLRDKVAEMNVIAERVNAAAIENHSVLRAMYPQAYGQQVQKLEAEIEELDPEKKRLYKRKGVLIGGGLLAAGVAGLLVFNPFDREEAQPVGGPATKAEGSTSGQGTGPSAGAQTERRGATPGAPEAGKDAVVEVRLTSEAIERGEPKNGADYLFFNLRRQLRERYGEQTSGIPETVETVLAKNPHLLAQALGFSGTVTTSGGRIPGSRIMHVGDTLTITERGELVFHDQFTNRDTILIDSKGRVVHVMRDILRPDRPEQQVRVAYGQPQASAAPRQPETRQEMQPAPQPAPIAPAATPEATPAPTPPPTASIPQQPTPVPPEVAPMQSQPQPQPDVPSAPPQPDIIPPTATQGAPEGPPPAVAPAPIPEAVPTTTTPPAAEAPQTPAAEGPESSQLWATYSSQDAHSIFDRLDSVDSGFRTGMLTFLRATGLGPREGEQVAQYVERARAAAREGNVSRPVVVQTPNSLFIATGGDPSARLIIAQEFLRANPDKSVIVERLTPASRGYILTSAIFSQEPGVIALTPVEAQRGLEVPEVTSDMRVVF